MKYFVWLVILLVVVGGGAAYWYSQERTAAASQTKAVDTKEVTRRTVEKVITANGKVASNRDVDIKCQASGKVIKLPFDISDHVKAGDLLLELDPIDQQRSLDQAVAQVKASEARLASAKVNFEVATMNLETTTSRTNAELGSAKAKAADALAKAERTQELFDSKLASKEELETAKTAATQADASVASAEAAMAELKQQKANLKIREQDIASAEAQLTQDTAKRDLSQRQFDYTKVYVPDDDTSKTADFRVAALGSANAVVQLGSIVQSGSSGFSGGTTVMTLSDVSHMFVLASVDESDIGQVSDPARGGEQQKARITADAYPGVQFDGEVQRVATKGVNATNVVTFEVKIEVTSPNKILLRPEMTATAAIIVAAKPNVLAIPVGAFTRLSTAERATRTGGTTTPAGAAGAEQATTGPAVAADSGQNAMPSDAQSGRRGGGRGGFGSGAGRGGGSRGGMGGGTARARPTLTPGAPIDGTVQVMVGDKPEPREVTVGLTDDAYYEVIKGLEEGEIVVEQKTSSDSRWKNQGQQNQSLMPRGIGGGGGRGR